MTANRDAYLNALGVQIWRTKAAPSAVAAPVSAVEQPPQVVAPQLAARADSPLPLIKVDMPPRAVAIAQPLLDLPHDWDALQTRVAGCERCKLCATRTQTVFGAGVTSAKLMIVGEAPGADEDASGQPFVGRAGKLLDEMLKAIGHTRAENVYIANVVKCRPPANRDPEPEEVEGCRPYLDAQIQLLQPKLILALGRIAAQRLLGSELPLSRLRGELQHYGSQKIPVMVTYHPAYLMRAPREKAKSWDDLKKVWQFLQ